MQYITASVSMFKTKSKASNVLYEQALKSLGRRMDETKLFYHNAPDEISNASRIFFQVRPAATV